MLTIIESRGVEARTFLQSQICGDINHLLEHAQLFSGICNLQGRVLATFSIYCQVQKNQNNNNPEEVFLITVHKSLVDVVMQRLQKFVLRTKVKLNINNSPNLLVQTVNFNFEKPQNWLISQCREYRVWLTAEHSEKYTPQMLGLDKNAGVSFTKGCYPGQEVVARTHYLGKAKRALYYTNINVDDEINLGDSIISYDELVENEAGVVLQVAKDNNLNHILTTLSIEQAKKSLSIVTKKAKIPLVNIISQSANE